MKQPGKRAECKLRAVPNKLVDQEDLLSRFIYKYVYFVICSANEAERLLGVPLFPLVGVLLKSVQ